MDSAKKSRTGEDVELLSAPGDTIPTAVLMDSTKRKEFLDRQLMSLLSGDPGSKSDAQFMSRIQRDMPTAMLFDPTQRKEFLDAAFMSQMNDDPPAAVTMDSPRSGDEAQFMSGLGASMPTAVLLDATKRRVPPLLPPPPLPP